MDLLSAFVCVLPLMAFFGVFIVAFGIASSDASPKQRASITFFGIAIIVVSIWLFTTLVKYC